MPSKLVRAGAVALFSSFLSLCSLTAANAAAPGPGDLVKLPDDGNLETTADSAVYYVGADGKRYAFPNSQTYFTWYADFGSVKVVTPAELAALQLGGNIVYRPGTRLVKITSDPHVYAVEPGGNLRWVQTEAVANALYGAEWNKRIDDVPDGFFVNYAIGEALAAAVYPDGTVVKRTSDQAYFLIQNRNKRKIASADVRAALRVQDTFVITTSADLSDYPDGADITTSEASLIDTSQRTSNIPSVPTFSARNPATNFFAVGGDATLLELHIASLKAVTVTRMTIKLDATTNNPADPSTDDDKGGLVYQNNAQPNFTQLRLRDAQGAEPFGRKELTLNIAQDQSQTFVFDGTFSVPASTDKVLYFMAKTNTLLPTGEGYKATLVVAGTAVRDASTGASAVFQPSADLSGPTLQSLNAALEVVSSTAPGNKTYVRGATDAELAGFGFKATTVAPNVVTGLTVQGYVDEEGTSGFLPAADADNGTETRVNAMVPTVSLWTSSSAGSAGTKLAGPVPVSLEGKATFTGFSYSIPAGQTAALVIKGDISKTIDLENAPNKLAFDVTDASIDVTATDDKGASIPVRGQNPNGGVTPLYAATIKNKGTATWTWAGQGGAAIVGREVLLGSLSVDVKDDAYDLKTVSFRQVGAASHSLGDVRLEYPSGTSKASVTGHFIGTSLTFSNLPVLLDRDKITELKLYGKIAPRDAGAVNGEVIAVQFDPAGALQFVSRSNGDSFDASTFTGPEFTTAANAASTVTVRFTGLTFAKDPASPAGDASRSSTTEVLRFTAKAEPEGQARIKKLTFKVTPADAGQLGTNNDALERWARVNGDFADDDSIVNLWLSLGSSRILVGEGTDGRVMYSMVHQGVKSSESSTLDSSAGDYGLIEYVFNDGGELFVAAGATVTFSLELDSSLMNSTADFGLGAELEGGSDLQWTDVPSGTYTPLGGTDATGVPLSGSVTVKK